MPAEALQLSPIWRCNILQKHFATFAKKCLQKTVYRGIERLEDDYTRPGELDFRSYAELGKKKTRGRRVDTTDPHYYGVSFFRKKEIVENMLAFPNPKKKMMKGNVYCEGGPEETNEETEHVCWWLYESVEFDGFLIV